MSGVPFAKPALSLSQQVDLLRSRGMTITHEQEAEETLLRLNYYRFSGYALHFEEFQNRQRTHRFKPGISFDQVVNLYEFDTCLRVLLFRYIEPVEVAFRAAICYELAIRTQNPHWYLERDMYDDRFDYDRLVTDCQRDYDRSDEVFAKSYREKYGSPALPPAWMMSEILSIGKWSLIFKNLVDGEHKKAVSHHFSTKPYYLESWIHSLSVLRNLCAHHCRIWNRNFTIPPALPEKLRHLVIGNARLAAPIVVLTHLLKTLGKNIEFQSNWDGLLARFPDVPRDKMGFPPQGQRVSRA